MRFCDYGLEDELLRCDVRMRKNQWVYCAPEVFEGKMDFKSDVWSLGIVLIEAAEGKNPYSDCTARAMFTADPPSLSSSEWPPEFISFVKRCLEKDANRRASVAELLTVSVSMIELQIASFSEAVQRLFAL